MNTIRSFVFCSAAFCAVAAFGDRLNERIAAAAAAGGGVVEVGPGRQDLRETLVLRDKVELRLADGAELAFVGSPENFSTALVVADGAVQVAVTGKGTFRSEIGRAPLRFFRFRDCRDLRLEGFRVRESPNWTIHLLESSNVVVRDLDVRCCGRNTDGVDVDSCDGVLIEGCRLDQGDDAIVMKSGKNADGRRRGKPTRNVTVRNCTVVRGHALLAVGSELSGGIENVRLENCTVEDEVWRVLFIKTNPARGGFVRDVSVRNVQAARAKCAIFEIMSDYQWETRERLTNPEIVRTPIDGVTVENVTCEEAWYAYDLRGDPAMKPRNIAIRDCTVQRPTRGTCRVENVDGLVAERIDAKPEPISIWCDDADSRYSCGDEAVFTVAATAKTGIAHVRLDNFGDRVLAAFDVDLATQRVFTVKGRRDVPGFLLLTVTRGRTVKRWGAAFDPETIEAGAACPDDFDAFWRGAIAKYDREVPVDVRLERLDAMSTNRCDVYRLSLSDPKGRTVYGYLKEPQDLTKGPFPAAVLIPGAGPSVGMPFVGDEQTVGLTMNVHYYKPVDGAAKRGPEHMALQKAEDDAWQRRYPTAVSRYTMAGIAAGREDYFYYGAILAINRAVNWLRTRSEVRLDKFRYVGGSQGGGLGLALVALNGHFAKATIAVPALTAHLCDRIDGREAGWPRLVAAQLPENRVAAARNAPYFDGVNFAARITCPIRFSVGYVDTVAPPHAGYAAFNVCPSADKAIIGSVGYGHSASRVDSRRMKRWGETWKEDD